MVKMKRTISILLATALIVTSAGCSQSGVKEPVNSAPLAPVKAQSELFEAYLMEEFREYVGESLLDSRFAAKNPSAYGITDIPLDIGRIDFAKYDDAAAIWQARHDELTAFDYDRLTEEQQFLYDLKKYQLDISKESTAFPYLKELNSPLTGIQSQLPSLLTEYQLYTVQDAYDYITMLEHVPDYFDDMAEFQRRKSERGLFMSDATLDNVLKSCKNVISNLEDNAIVTGFPARIEGLPDITGAQIEELTALNRNAFFERIVPAYEAFIKSLEALRGTGKNEGGLSGYEGGKIYYEYLVKEKTGSDRSIEEIARMLDTELSRVMITVSLILERNPDAFDRYLDLKMDFGTPYDIMKLLEEKTAEAFPKVASLTYDIKEIAPELEEHSAPAFFFIPQVDDPFNNSIYINNRYLEDNAVYLFTTLAHEGYPGHMYQHSYFSSTDPHPVRYMLQYDGYSEGWASYVEQLSYEMTGIEDETALLLKDLFSQLSLLLSSRADIGVNYEGWDKTVLKNFLTYYNFGEGDLVDQIFSSVVEDPANYHSYMVGMLEFQKLRRYAELELQSDFDAMEFHKTILEVGPSPFSIVRAAVDDYIDRVQSEPAASKAA